MNTDSREVIGKTCDSATFSGDVGSREKIKGQTYITTEDVDDNMTVRGDGNDNLIRKVEKAEKIEVADYDNDDSVSYLEAMAIMDVLAGTTT